MEIQQLLCMLKLSTDPSNDSSLTNPENQERIRMVCSLPKNSSVFELFNNKYVANYWPQYMTATELLTRCCIEPMEQTDRILYFIQASLDNLEEAERLAIFHKYQDGLLFCHLYKYNFEAAVSVARLVDDEIKCLIADQLRKIIGFECILMKFAVYFDLPKVAYSILEKNPDLVSFGFIQAVEYDNEAAFDILAQMGPSDVDSVFLKAVAKSRAKYVEKLLLIGVTTEVIMISYSTTANSEIRTLLFEHLFSNGLSAFIDEPEDDY